MHRLYHLLSNRKILLILLFFTFVLSAWIFATVYQRYAAELMNKRPLIIFLISLAVLVAISVATGCQATRIFETGEHTVKSQDEVGEMTLAVSSVIPWDKELLDKMLPKFEMSGAAALTQVVPATALMEERILDSFQLRGRVATPSSLTTETRITKETNSAPAETTLEKKEETKPGDVEKAPKSQAEAKLPEDPFKDALAKAQLAIDPLLKHQAALALNEEVQILNAVLANAVPAKYKAFVVRLQVGVVPYARHQPYDTYATFAFFPQDSAARVKSNPVVLPLLVSDNLEGAMQARTAEQLRQFALGLAAMIQGVGAEAEFEKISGRLQSILGTDINSLLTVGQLAPNVIRVRFGAMNQPGSRFAMIPRNQFVSLLMLVREDDLPVWMTQGIQIGMTAEFRHARTGAVLPPRSPKRTTELLMGLGKITGLNQDQLMQLLESVEQNQRDRFEQDYQGFSSRNKSIDGTYVWTSLIEFRLGSKNRVAAFRLSPLDSPPQPKPELPPGTNKAVLFVASDRSELSMHLQKDAPPVEAAFLAFTRGREKLVVRCPAPNQSAGNITFILPPLKETLRDVEPGSVKLRLHSRETPNGFREYDTEVYFLSTPPN
jgi:hypothetical protein